jgi:hypothetical protein
MHDTDSRNSLSIAVSKNSFGDGFYELRLKGAE